MKRIRFFRQNTVDSLRATIKENLPWYRNENNTLLESIVDEYGQMSQSIDRTCFDNLNENTKEEDDLENTIAIYTALDGLSPQQAAEEKIWVYATHILAKQYTSKRWSKIPTDDNKAVHYVLSHYFVSGARGLIRDNAVSRLWWMGHLASRCQDYKLETTLRILLRDSDVRANLLERSSVSMSKEIFSGVIRALGKSIDANNSNPALYKRKNFRALMKMLNRRGGRIMLNALGEKKLDDMLESMVKQVTENHND